MSTIDSLHSAAAVSCLNLVLICILLSHGNTKSHICCKCNYTLLFFLHFRGTNHIAGSRLSIGKAGVYSKEQDKKKSKRQESINNYTQSFIAFNCKRKYIYHDKK